MSNGRARRRWPAFALALLAIWTLCIGERRGAVALAGLVSLLAGLPALLHPTGISAPLVVAAVTAVAGGVLAGVLRPRRSVTLVGS